MPKVTKISATINPVTLMPLSQVQKRRVAAYARVSTDSDEQFTSFEAQVDYYTKYINNHPDWELVKVYTDEGISGTSIKHRDGFNEMIEDAKNGKIDLIVTKSVSRFARNTVDSLTTIRELKTKNVEVFFEKENIYTFDSKGELLITIMSSLAQEESRSISENVTWGVRKGFSDGKFSVAYKMFLGFEKGENGRPKIVESEAQIIRDIYGMFLEGKSTYQIADELNARGVKTPKYKRNGEGEKTGKWKFSTVLSILKNEKYKGEAILQKTYTTDFLSHAHKVNNGELPKYHVKNSHDFIIPPEEWEMVQLELERRAKLDGKYSATTIFSTKLICGDCGRYYGQKVWHSTDKYRRVIYQCNDKFSNTVKCKTPHLTEQQVIDAFLESFNKVNNDNVIDDCMLAIEVLSDTSKLDEEEMKLNIESKSLVEIARTMNEENARVPLNQNEYRTKYENLVKKQTAIIKRLEEIQEDKNQRMASIKKIQITVKIFKEQEGSLMEFYPKLWTMLVDKAIVNNDRTIKFIYYTGIENIVEIK